MLSSSSSAITVANSAADHSGRTDRAIAASASYFFHNSCQLWSISSGFLTFGISSQQNSSAKELHIALQQIHTGLHVIVAKMPERDTNADYLNNIIKRFQQLVLEEKFSV